MGDRLVQRVQGWHPAAQIVVPIVAILGTLALGFFLMWWGRGVPLAIVAMVGLPWLVLRERGPLGKGERVGLEVAIVLLAVFVFPGPFILVSARRWVLAGALGLYALARWATVREASTIG